MTLVKENKIDHKFEEKKKTRQISLPFKMI